MGSPERYPTEPGREPGIELHATGLDLSHTDLSAYDLADVWWNDCNLDGSRLQDAWMPGMSSYRTSWRQCDLSRAQIAKSEAVLSDFSRAILCGAYLLRSGFRQCDLRAADLSGANLTKLSARDCDARQLIIRDTVLDRFSLDDSHVAQLDLTGSSGTIGGRGSGYPRINIGEPDEPNWLVEDEALEWLRSRGAPALTFYGRVI